MKKTTFIADGNIKKFSFDFPFFLKSNVVVTVNGAPATNYNMVCVSNGMNANIPFSGGYIMFTRPPKYGDVVTISRSLPLDRVVDYQPTAEIKPTAINQDFNYMIEILKDMMTGISDIVNQPSESQNKDRIDTIGAQIEMILSDIEELNTRITAGGTGDGDGTTVDLTGIQASIATLTTRCNELAATIENMDTLPTGADYVVASQLPTAENNYTWYRKYASGWVEQGGIVNNLTSNVHTITLPVIMADANYNIQLSDYISGSSPSHYSFVRDIPTVSTINIKSNSNSTINRTFWCVSGYAG